MEPYIHRIHYYETDKMGITHHSNYIRWMEEARVHYLDQIGWGYDKLESMGITSPVIGVEAKFKKTTTFHEDIAITTAVADYTGIRLFIRYEMTSLKTGQVVFIGMSEHCFLDLEGRPIRMKRDFPAFHEALEGRKERK